MEYRPLFFDKAADALKPVLENLPGKLVVIDGRDGSGKSSLGRFLAWYFNVSLVETDHFLIGNGELSYDTKCIDQIITKRLSRPRPVIVEGIAILELMTTLKRSIDFHIYLRRLSFEGSHSLQSMLELYESNYHPAQVANLILVVP